MRRKGWAGRVPHLGAARFHEEKHFLNSNFLSQLNFSSHLNFPSQFQFSHSALCRHASGDQVKRLTCPEGTAHRNHHGNLPSSPVQQSCPVVLSSPAQQGPLIGHVWRELCTTAIYVHVHEASSASDQASWKPAQKRSLKPCPVGLSSNPNVVTR